MKIRKSIVIGMLSAALFAGGAVARTAPPTGTPPAVQQLIACRAIADSTQRLACYDRQAGVIQQAIASRDLVVIDKQKADEAKRGLFGFATTGMAGLFGGGDIKQIESTVTSYTRNADGGWIIRLADGSVWGQTDDAQLGLPPQRGDKVKVTRGFGGSFFVQLGKQPGFRARRVG
jgi:hypothetical protein